MPDANETYMQYHQYIDAVFRVELKKRRDAGWYISREDEEDLHQTIILKVLKYIPRHDPQKSSIKTYLYTIVKTQLKWQMIWMYGMEGRHSKESWYRSFERLDGHWDAPAGRTIDDVIEGMEKPMRKAVMLLLDGASHKQVRQLLCMTDEEWEAMLDEIRDYLTECSQTHINATRTHSDDIDI